ncbi:DedA family protein [Pseudonocardia sp. DLS-67]
MLTALLHAAAGWSAPVVLAVSCAVLVVESGTLVGMALPGSTLLVALGLWSLTAPHALVPAIAASALGTVAGAHLGWWRGRAGPPVARLPGPLRRLAEPRAAQASAWLAQRQGPATTLLLACGHWAAAARPVMPRVAGAAGVPYRIAGPSLIVSGSAWAATIVLLGNRIGALVLTSAAWVPVAFVALLVVVLVLRSRCQRRRSPSGRPGATVDEGPLIHASSRGHPAPPAWAGDPRPQPRVEPPVMARAPVPPSRCRSP